MPLSREKVSIKFYTIERCGYYKYDAMGTEVRVSGVSNILENLQRWLDNRTLAETKTTDCLRASIDKIPVYCLSVKRSRNGHFLVTTWNETKSTEGKIFSIDQDQIASDNTAIETTELPEGHIPGYATYFWFIPEDNVFATIRFKHIENGHFGLQAYMKGFLSFFTDHVCLSDSMLGQGYEITGYKNDQGVCDDNLNPYFRSKLVRLPGTYDMIINSFASIKKVIRRASLSYSYEEDLTLFETAMKKFGLATPSTMRENLEVEFMMKTTPTQEEVEEMIDEWRSSHSATWDDVGFIFNGNPNQTHWLSSEVPKKELEIDVERHNEELVDTEILLNTLDNLHQVMRNVYQSQ